MADNLQHIAVCPGSFDPITEGHVDVIRRASQMFEKVYVAIAEGAEKDPLFSVDERVAMARAACTEMANVEVDSFVGLVVEYARQRGAVALVKGLRAITDFDREMQMSWMNRQLAPDLCTVFLVSHPDYAFLSSSLVKDVAGMGGDVTKFVPEPVLDRLKEKLVRH